MTTETQGVTTVTTETKGDTTPTTQTQGVGGIAANPSTPSGTLPFTGMTLLWVVVLGAGLLLLGVVLRQRGRRGSS